jgi:hypothetical protein
LWYSHVYVYKNFIVRRKGKFSVIPWLEGIGFWNLEAC